jgi:hypothetical protein
VVIVLAYVILLLGERPIAADFFLNFAEFTRKERKKVFK